MRSARRLAAVACLALVSTTGVVPSTAAPTPPAVRTVAASSSAVTVDKSVQRTFLDDGRTTVVDKRNVSLTVDVTTKLHSLQLINVSWSGAHPTGALVADQNSDAALNEEYPFALFECRGDDSPAHPLSPETCWTQFSTERFTTGSDDPPYPAWRGDSAATPAQRAAVVNAPRTLNAACTSALAGNTVQRWVPFQGADGTVYPGGPNGCAGQPPEASPLNLASTVALPSNETFGVTDAEGNGSAAFNIFTDEDHASLGCSATTACSLVAVPIMGLSCDPSGAKLPADQRPDADGAAILKDGCEAGPRYRPGQPLPRGGAGSETAVNGSLWWSPSNWANRLAVPLSFAPADNACSLNGGANSVDVFGSELMSQATTLWSPVFCLNKNLFDFTHVQTPEPLARTLLGAGTIEAAFGSSPPDTPYRTPTVQAPVAVTGFGIGYTMDDKDGREITGLKLDARLIAKLLTSSYPDIVAVRTGHPGLQNNPYNITQDPEFQALNPGVPVRNVGADGAASLLNLNTDSDVVHALTAYVAADPEARAWLDGAPDPWGMTVNPNYLKFVLPVTSLALLDDYIPRDYYDSGAIPCLQGSKVPYLQYVAAPTARLFSIAQDLEFALVQSQTTCVLPSGTVGDTTGAKMVAAGRQDSGNHAMFGLVSLGDAARNGVQVASLETYTSSSAATKFTDTSGRSFAAPSQAGLRATAAALTADPKSGVWPIPYASLRSAEHEAAYPGTMLVYADVPTTGLPAGDGPKYAKLLTFAAGDGQHPGTDRGELPPGFLPMTSANGFGPQVAYTRRSANAVGAQRGYLPSLTKADPPASGATAPPAPTAPTGGGGGGTSAGAQPGPGVAGAGGVPAAGAGGARPTTRVGGPVAPIGKAAGKSVAPVGAQATQPAPALAAARTPSLGSGIGGWALPVLLLLFLAALGGGLITRLGSRQR